MTAKYRSCVFENVSFADSKGLGCADLIFDEKSADNIVERFKNENVDAVLIINCNFGNEEAVAQPSKALGKPVLLWAPLDDEYYKDGMRPTDSQYGLRNFKRFRLHCFLQARYALRHYNAFAFLRFIR